jgi:Ca-activated chloride channel family protein
VSETGWRFHLLGYPAGFAQPVLLALVLVGGVVAAFGIWAALKRRAQLSKVLSEPHLDALAPGLSVGRPAVQSGLYGLSLVLFAIALAEPQCGGKVETVKRKGIDLVVAIDASKSMLARDVSPSRLDRAKLEVSTLLDELKGDRVGIVVFAGDAFIQCPLTVDYSAAKMFLRAIDPEQMQEPGTNIGNALSLSKQMLDATDRGAKERVVLLISDGEDLAGEGKEEAAALKDEKIKIFSVGIGSETGEPIPIIDRRGNVAGYKKDPQGNPVLTRLDRQGLQDLADATGGQFFYEPHGVAVGGVVEQIDKMQKSDLDSRIAVHYDEKYQAFALPALLFLLAGMFVPLSRRRAKA